MSTFKLKHPLAMLTSILLFSLSTTVFASISDINRAVENSRHLEPGESFALDQPCKLFNNYEHKIYHCTAMIGPLSLIKDHELDTIKNDDELLYREVAFVRKEDGQPVFRLLPREAKTPEKTQQTLANEPSEQSAKKQLSHVGFLAK
ncbi:hypothetical protein [Photobacterium angustum]|uniref:Uncharacterized protein n=1 Tax=Photobacterium angustum TaxID=661 RepID=A0A855S7T0_PHOAN|nr:hypothetical protein [Photobacterium angustum]KJF82102.1 hypothetical protein UB36_08795 [Photobacterium damselae subsp. damselae]KJG41163.1 hypothetical protein UA35_10545 [Photobacterium angustum]KJG45941.1 hypothetical protein UA31_08800 [Photobacterium angustum]KJG48926.1 hypothetical protein UA30_10995 [Photobacterium angustum]KJG52948.1 hypothetical protein UA34_11015 [Photobacterium angustum]